MKGDHGKTPRQRMHRDHSPQSTRRTSSHAHFAGTGHARSMNGAAVKPCTTINGSTGPRCPRSPFNGLLRAERRSGGGLLPASSMVVDDLHRSAPRSAGGRRAGVCFAQLHHPKRSLELEKKRTLVQFNDQFQSSHRFASRTPTTLDPPASSGEKKSCNLAARSILVHPFREIRH